ncbi:MAG: flavodoxin family protein [bacterium]|nr:flavodoxin family protein [bacterium]
MKALIVTGSHRKNQVSYATAEKFSKILKEKTPADIEICQLATLKIDNCCATSECTTSGENRCVRKHDDFNMLYDKMSQSDMVFFIVPKYAPYPSRFMAMLERMTAISWWGYGQHQKMDDFIMAGKPAAMLAFTSVPGIPKEVFYPLFFTFGELGFDTIRFDGVPGGVPGISYSKGEKEGEEDALLTSMADSFIEKLSATH